MLNTLYSNEVLRNEVLATASPYTLEMMLRYAQTDTPCGVICPCGAGREKRNRFTIGEAPTSKKIQHHFLMMLDFTFLIGDIPRTLLGAIWYSPPSHAEDVCEVRSTGGLYLTLTVGLDLNGRSKTQTHMFLSESNVLASLGVILHTCLNTRLNVLISEKPHS